MKLFRTELTRFWSRRIVWITAVTLALVFTAGTVIGFFQTSKELTSKEEAIGTCINFETPYLAENDSYTREEIKNYCEEESSYRHYQDDRRFWMQESLVISSHEDGYSEDEDSQNDYYITDLEKNRLSFPDRGFEGILPTIAIPLLIIMTLLGASFIGAEYRSGTVENLLLWEPRRWKVLGTKYLAGGLSASIFMAAALSLLTALLTILTVLHGTFEGTGSTFWIDILGVILRSSGLAFLAFTFAMAIATITRYTAAAVVVLLGWAIVSNILIETFLTGFKRWELITNAQAFIAKGDVPAYIKNWCEVDGTFSQCYEGGWNQTVTAHGYLAGGLTALLWAAIPALIAIAVFQRRDLS